MDQAVPLHPANAKAIAGFAEETGAEVLCGAFRYPSESGGWQLGGTSLTHSFISEGYLYPRRTADLWPEETRWVVGCFSLEGGDRYKLQQRSLE
jgi:hypothetical protein